VHNTFPGLFARIPPPRLGSLVAALYRILKALLSLWRFFSCLLIPPPGLLVFFLGFHLSSLISSICLCHFHLRPAFVPSVSVSLGSLSRISSLVSPSTYLCHFHLLVLGLSSLSLLIFSLNLISYFVLVTTISVCFPLFFFLPSSVSYDHQNIRPRPLPIQPLFSA